MMRPPSRGDVWIVGFDPAVGDELQKFRPAVVVNVPSVGRLCLRIIVPVTDWKPYYAQFPWFVFLAPTPTNGLTKDSGADAFQVKSISLARFQRKVGEVPDDQMGAIAAAIALCVGLP